MRLLEADEPHRAQHTLKRILTILKVMVAQLDILETMTPLEFLTLPRAARCRQRVSVGPVPPDRVRARREDRSGDCSASPEGSRARAALERRYARPTLWDAFLRYLARERYPVPPAQLARDVVAPVEPSPEIQAILVDVYRRDPKNAELCERLVDLDEGIQEWRYRHVKMVERTIGAKPGTGGSAGAAYLRETVGRPLFPDLVGNPVAALNCEGG